MARQEGPLVTPENVAGINVLNRFVTQIWEHPLLTDLTRGKRAYAFSFVEELMGERKGMFLVPVGSAIWIAAVSSDVDFLLLHTPENDIASHKIRDALDGTRDETVTDPRVPLLSCVGKYGINPNLHLVEMNTLSSLFVTPDEYIVGDHELVRQTRLRMLDPASFSDINGVSEDTFAEIVNAKMNAATARIKQWPTRGFRYIEHEKNNSIRYAEMLLERASRTHNPQEYILAFQRGFEKLSPPDFFEMRTALQFTGGAMHLDNRFRAQGL